MYHPYQVHVLFGASDEESYFTDCLFYVNVVVFILSSLGMLWKTG